MQLLRCHTPSPRRSFHPGRRPNCRPTDARGNHGTNCVVDRVALLSSIGRPCGSLCEIRQHLCICTVVQHLRRAWCCSLANPDQTAQSIKGVMDGSLHKRKMRVCDDQHPNDVESLAMLGNTIFRAIARHVLALVPSRRKLCQHNIQVSLFRVAWRGLLDGFNILKQDNGGAPFLDIT